MEIQGQMLATANTIVFEKVDQGTMVGSVKPLSATQFEFRLNGLPASETAMVFAKQSEEQDFPVRKRILSVRTSRSTLD